MKYVVIGGAGYIGSHLVDQLCENGHEVTVFDNMSTGEKLNLHKDADLIVGDIREPQNLDDLFSIAGTVDCVFHFAGLKAAGESNKKKDEYKANNIVGTKNILQSMVTYDIKNIVFSSSAAVYGNPEYLPINEDHPTNPINYYGETKLQAERLLGMYDAMHGIKSASLRYFNAAGYSLNGHITVPEKKPTNLLPSIMEVAISTIRVITPETKVPDDARQVVFVLGDNYDTRDGTGVRDYIHVDDLVDAHIKAAHQLVLGNSFVVNLGTGAGYSVIDVIKAATKAVGFDVPFKVMGARYGDPATVIASGEKALDLLDWKPVCSDIETILSSMWRIYK